MRTIRAMAQRTLVYKVPAASAAEIEALLAGGAFERRTVPHARWSVKGEGVVATLYSSGKLVVQGASPEEFIARFTPLEGAGEGPRKKAPESGADELARTLTEPWAGSDEAGKGDYFGPLVVAAVRLTPELALEVVAEGIADSKTLSDGRALKLGAFLRARVPFAIRRLDPEEYNAVYARSRGLNRMLAGIHAEVLREVAQPGDKVLVDQFGAASLMSEALQGDDVELHQRTKAERHPSVAAASVLARQEFLVGLMELGQEHGFDLPKGAGAQVDDAGVGILSEGGDEALARVAKVHFKNTEKIRARL